jgi:hypothetical protein
MDRAVRSLVRDRAGDRCEYCGMRQNFTPFAVFHVEHIIPKHHGGSDDPSNLAYACNRCSYFKGSNVGGVDPHTGRLVFLFNPRRQKWKRHFQWDGPILTGRTAVGRTTIVVMEINHPRRIALRQRLVEEGVFPPHP